MRYVGVDSNRMLSSSCVADYCLEAGLLISAVNEEQEVTRSHDPLISEQNDDGVVRGNSDYIQDIVYQEVQ